MPVPGMPLYTKKTLSADGAVSANPCRIMAIEVSDVATDVKLEFTDDANGAGTNVLECTAAAESGGLFRDYTNLGGVAFPTKCYLDLTGGASIVVFVWIDDLKSP